MGDATRDTASRSRRATRARPRATFTGVLGELLITVGVVVLLYVGWQMWIGDWIMGAENNAQGQELSQEWADDPVIAPTAAPTPDPTATPATPEPIALPQPKDGKTFAVVHIPRFGDGYAVKAAGGVTKPRTLDKGLLGHYPGTAMPGQVGNFALAGHRTTWGAPLGPIADLRLGDAIVVETPEGWYTYRFRTLEYVKPSAVDVLDTVPRAGNQTDGDRYITLTSCSPRYSNAERIIAYGLFEAFQPRADGPPASLSPAVGA